MGAKMYYFQMATLFVCLVLLAISYMNNDGNIKFELNFTITQSNTFLFALKHRQLEYGVNKDTYETKYSEMDLELVIDRLFTADGSFSDTVITQMLELTNTYADNLIDDIESQIGGGSQDLIDEIRRYTPTVTYADDINEIMRDLNFAESMNVSDETNDAFRMVEYPSMLVFAGMILCIVTMIMITLFYFEKLPESCCCKCLTSFCCFLPALFSILVIGVAWIVLAQLYEDHVDIDWNSGERAFKDGVELAVNDYFLPELQQFIDDNGIDYDFAPVLTSTLDGVGNFQDEVSVGTSPWLQSLAGLLFFVFACGFCCCQTKKEEQGKIWQDGVEFGSFN